MSIHTSGMMITADKPIQRLFVCMYRQVYTLHKFEHEKWQRTSRRHQSWRTQIAVSRGLLRHNQIRWRSFLATSSQFWTSIWRQRDVDHRGTPFPGLTIELRQFLVANVFYKTDPGNRKVDLHRRLRLHRKTTDRFISFGRLYFKPNYGIKKLDKV